MVLDHQIYVALFTLVATWANEERDRCEILECARECVRAILGVTGVHRASEVLAELWVLLTEVRIAGTSQLGAVQPCCVEIASAAPSPVCVPLCELGKLKHADILEEELAATLEWTRSMIDYNGDTDRVDEWLKDLEYFLQTTQFVLMHRLGWKNYTVKIFTLSNCCTSVCIPKCIFKCAGQFKCASKSFQQWSPEKKKGTVGIFRTVYV